MITQSKVRREGRCLLPDVGAWDGAQQTLDVGEVMGSTQTHDGRDGVLVR